MIRDNSRIIIGIDPLAMDGLIWEDVPRASNRFDRKYTVKIKMNEIIKVLKNLSFCFKLLDKLADNITKLIIKNGRKIRL